MKVQSVKEGEIRRITFVCETEEEQLIMGGLRNHYFFGLPEDGTYPEYDGITEENNRVTSMKFKFKSWDK